MRTVLLSFVAIVLSILPVPRAIEADGEQPAVPTKEFKVIVVQHRVASDLVPLLKEASSEGGTLVADAATNSLVVNDLPAAIQAIEERLAEIDVAPKGESLQIKMQVVVASNKKGVGDDSEALRALLPTLQEVLAFTSYEMASEAIATVRERSSFNSERDDEFAWSFIPFIETIGLPVRLEKFNLSVATKYGRFVMETDLRLPLDKPVVLGCASLDSAEQAVIVVLTAGKIK